jgi:hypothetical protein
MTKMQKPTRFPVSPSAATMLRLTDEVRRLRASNRELLAACRAVMNTCGPAEDWQGETRVFLRLVEMAVANVEKGGAA